MFNPHKARLFVFNIAVPLIIGGILYLYLRPDSIVATFCRDAIGLNIGFDIDNPMITLVRYYLGDCLWAYALTVSVSMVLYDNSVVTVFVFCILFEAILEILQLTGWVWGSFDIWDIVVEVISSGLAVLRIMSYRKNEVTV